uniref:Ribosomal protein S3 C-terminal domain-containing protein n=1 Tax=Aegilops tauschii subsp. strangulata TaxID=200361 RepID=A0A453RVC0_AEGTS
MLQLGTFFSDRGVLGIKVKIMLDWDPKGKLGPTTPLPDLVTIHP